MGALRTKMIGEMRLRNLAARIQKAYVAAVVGLVKYCRKPPDAISAEEIRACLLHLEDRGLSPNSRNVAISGLRFFYQETLGWQTPKLFLPPRKKVWRLPEVLSQEEVQRLLGAARLLRDRCLLMTAYGRGCG